MKDGFIKVAAGTPDVQVADCEFNAAEIIKESCCPQGSPSRS